MLTCIFEDDNKASLRHVVVDSIVLKDDKVLLVKRTSKLLEGGKWALVGGFVDRDETIAEAAKREILEETGWEVKDLQLMMVVDNPNRPNEDRQNVSFKYFCNAVKKTGEPDWESDDQQWFSLDQLPPKEQIAFDHYSDLELYKRYLKEKFALPILP